MSKSERVGDLWGAEARDWAELQEPLSGPLWVAMLDACHVGRGTALLDVGCGGGGAELIADERGARITGLDAAQNSIALARSRLPDADFRVGDMDALPFDDAAFDAVIAVNSIQFVADAERALAELVRVAKPGGYVSVAIFAGPDKVDEDVVFNAIADLLPPPKPSFPEYRFSEPGLLGRMLEEAGLDAVETREINTPFDYKDAETAWRAQRSAGSIQEVMNAVGEDRVKQAALGAFAKFARPDGSIHLDNMMIYATGRR